jgi:MFS family permease
VRASDHTTRRGIMIGMFIASISLGLTMPLFALSLHVHGVSSFLIGVNAVAPALGIVAVSPLVPYLIRIGGLRICLLISAALFVTLVLLLPLWIGFWPWFFIRFVIGTATGTYWIAGEAWLNGITPNDIRGRVISAYGATSSIGLAAGPLILNWTDTKTVLPFAVAAGLIICATGLLLLVRSTDTLLVSDRSVRFGEAIRCAPTATIAAFVSGFVAFSQIVLLPVYIARMDLPTAASTAALSSVLAGAIVGRVLLGWVADRYDRHVVLLAILLVCLVASVVPIYATTASPVFWCSLLFWGGGISALYSMSMILVGDKFEADSMVSSSAALRAAYHLGNILGPATAGLAMDILAPNGLMFVSLAITAVFFGAELRGRTLRQARHALPPS